MASQTDPETSSRSRTVITIKAINESSTCCIIFKIAIDAKHNFYGFIALSLSVMASLTL